MTDAIVAGGQTSCAVQAPMFTVPLFGNVAIPREWAPLPPYKGSGSLSGTVPYVVTYGGVAAAVTLDLFDRSTNAYIMSTASSAVDGSFSFTGLNTARQFDVRARGSGFVPGENDLIIAGVTPA